MGRVEGMWCQQQLKPLPKGSNKVDEQKELTVTRCRSEALANNKTNEAKVNGDDISSKPEARKQSPNDGGHYTPEAKETWHVLGSNLGSFGSVTKEKERRRTLASKLLEERLNANRGEGMDSLWEAYETKSIKIRPKTNRTKEKKGSNELYDDDEGEEEENDVQLYCVQAFKFSAVKMNLGLGRPISKALKGIGWLHHVSRRGKSGCH